MTKRRKHAEPRRYWTKAEDRILRAKYPHIKTEKLLPMLPGRTLTTTYQRAAQLGLKKSASYLASPDACRLRRGQGAGVEYRFKKGQTAWNKGKHYIPGGRCKDGWFRPGQRSVRWDEETYGLGALRLTTDGCLLIKATPDRARQSWQIMARFVWESERGPIPHGYIVRAKNGDSHDTRIENLECISREENLRRNYHDRYPLELRRLNQLRGALQRQINKREGKHERQHDQRSS